MESWYQINAWRDSRAATASSTQLIAFPFNFTVIFPYYNDCARESGLRASLHLVDHSLLSSKDRANFACFCYSNRGVASRFTVNVQYARRSDRRESETVYTHIYEDMGRYEHVNAPTEPPPSADRFYPAENPVPATLLATFITAQALRPPQFLPLLFPPVLLFSTYLNLNDYKVDAAGISAAWSGLYMLLARRRKQSFVNKWGTRGLIRGATLGLCGANLVAGGLVYALGKSDNKRGKMEPQDQ